MLLMIACTPPILKKRGLTKTLLIMNLTAILLTATCLQVSAMGFAQTITLSEKHVPLQKVFKSIEDQTGYVFFFNYAWLRHARKVSVEAKNASLMEALELCFKDQPLTYEIVNKTIVLKPKMPTVTGLKSHDPLHGPPIDVKAPLIVDKEEPALKVVHTVTGMVTNEKGEPLAGASISEKGYSIGVTTDNNGRFSINLTENEGVLVISHVGYQEQEIAVGTRNTFDIKLISLNAAMDAVVIVGYGTQKKSDITGSVTSVPKDRLSKNPVTNVLQALE
jgi:hypothetical protein